jgi:hypothetical protein
VCTRTVSGSYTLGPLVGGNATLDFRASQHWPESATVALPANGIVAGPSGISLERGVRLAPTDVALRQVFFDEGSRRALIDIGGRLDMVDTAAPAPLAPLTVVPDLFDAYLGLSPDGQGFLARRATRLALGRDGDIAYWSLQGGAGSPLLLDARPRALWSEGFVVGVTQTVNGVGRLQSNRVGGMANTLGRGHIEGRLVVLSTGELAWLGTNPNTFQLQAMIGNAIGTVSRSVLTNGAPLPAASPDFLLSTAGRQGLLWRSAAGALLRISTSVAFFDTLLPNVSGVHPPLVLEDGSVVAYVPEGAADAPPYAAKRITFAANLAPNATLNLGNGLTISGAARAATGLYAARAGAGLVFAPFDGSGVVVLGGAAVGNTFELVASGGGAVFLSDGRAFRHTPGLAAESLNLDGLSALKIIGGGAVAYRAAQRQHWWLPGPGQAGAPRMLSEGGDADQLVLDLQSARVYSRGNDGWGVAALPAGARVRLDTAPQRITPLSATTALGLMPDGGLRAFDTASGASYGWAGGVTLAERAPNGAWVVYASTEGLYLVSTAP